MTPLTRSQRDEAKRTSTLTRIEKYILEAIRKLAQKNNTSIKEEIEYVLLYAFKIKSRPAPEKP